MTTKINITRPQALFHLPEAAIPLRHCSPEQLSTMTRPLLSHSPRHRGTAPTSRLPACETRKSPSISINQLSRYFTLEATMLIVSPAHSSLSWKLQTHEKETLRPSTIFLYFYFTWVCSLIPSPPSPQQYKAAIDSKINLKLLIDASSNKVLFGEAGKEFIDFMFSILTLPLGSVIKLLSPKIMVGTIGKLYQSVEKLNETYLVANRDKSSLLQPKVSTFDVATPLLLGPEATAGLKYYLCSYCNRKVTTTRGTLCPNCRQAMAIEVAFVVPSGSDSSSGSGNGGFVKEVIAYMITDDLEVTPMSAISSITLINRFSIKKDVQLVEKVVTVSMKEGLALLKASLDSSTVLTDVFCSFSKK